MDIINTRPVGSTALLRIARTLSDALLRTMLNSMAWYIAIDIPHASNLSERGGAPKSTAEPNADNTECYTDHDDTVSLTTCYSTLPRCTWHMPDDATGFLLNGLRLMFINSQHLQAYNAVNS